MSSQISEYPFQENSVAEFSSFDQPAQNFQSNLKIGQVAEKREEFAVSLRKSKKKEILDKRRLKLGTKDKFGYPKDPMPIHMESPQLVKLEIYLKSVKNSTDFKS